MYKYTKKTKEIKKAQNPDSFSVLEKDMCF